MKKLHNFLIIILLSSLIACGGGGSDGGSKTSAPTPPTPTPTPVPVSPTATVSFTASSGGANTDVVIANLTGSENIDSWTFELNGVTSYLVVNGTKILIENNTVDVSSYASKDFQLMLNHDTAETVNISVTSFTVDGKSYDLDANQDITFTAPQNTNTGRLEIKLQTEGSGITVKNTQQSTPQRVQKGQTDEFLLQNAKAKIYSYVKGVPGKTLYTTIDLVLDSGKHAFQHNVGDYFIEVSGTANMNGVPIVFTSTQDTTIPQGGLSSIIFSLTAEEVSAAQVDMMEDYDSTFVDGDTKNITFSDIMQENSCIQTLKEDHFVLKVNGSTSLKYEYFCLTGDAIYGGWKIQTNHFVTMSFKSDSMSDAYSIDLQGDFQPVYVSFTLPKGNSSLDINLSNVALSDEDLKVDIQLGPTFGLSTEHLLISSNLGYSVNIIE